ncbi:MAG: FtsX-like permease family protein, partial [Candidatus Acidiferrales bacterium]
MLAGREFEGRDQRIPTAIQADAPKNASLPVVTRAITPAVLPAVMNETAAQKLFGIENAVGKRVRDSNQSYEVIGVVRDLKTGFGTMQSVMYLPLTSRDFARPPAGGITILARSDAGNDALTAVRNEIASIDPNLTIFNVRTFSEYLDSSRSAIRLAAQTYGGIGVFGLVLAAVGLAGVTAYAVAQRRKEIAIRTALGATKAQVLRLVLREGGALVGVGTVLGFLGAMALAKILSALTNIFVQALSVGTSNARLLIGAPLLLAAVAMLACYIPARRSAQIDPLQALREE